ncbi:MAG TPA: MMPL family transporter [Conexibacter sp.]|nr:MMPL family transporter [Conexibacter sp.]
MLHRLGDWVAQHPWRVVLVWALVALPLTLVGGEKLTGAITDDQAHFLPASSDSARATQLGRDAFGHVEGVTPVTGLVERADGGALTTADRDRVVRLTQTLPQWRPDWKPIERDAELLLGLSDDQRSTRVVAAAPGQLADGGRMQLLEVGFSGNATDPVVQDAFEQLRDRSVHELAGDGLQLGFTGGVATELDSTQATATISTVEGALLMAAIVLLNLLFFRGVLAALVPLLAVTLVGGAAVGLIGLGATVLDVKLDAGTPSLIPAVLVGIGVDYFLFLIFRFREQLRTGAERKPAAAAAAKRVGEVIASAALAVIAAFATLGLAQFGQFKVLGPSIAISVALMMLAGLTLMPALLAICGRRLFWPSKQWLAPREGGFATRLGERIAARPGAVALACVAVLGACAAVALTAKSSYDLGGGPDDTTAAQVEQRISRALSDGATDPQTVFVRAQRPLADGALDPLAARLRAVPGVAEVTAPQLSQDRTAGQVGVVLEDGSTSERAMETVRGPLRTAAREAAPPGSEALVGGNAAVFADIGDSIDHDLKIIFPVAAALIALILVAILRSVVAPLYLLAVVALEFAATLGLVVLVFQHAAGRPGIVFTMPLVLFLFVVALGTDYNILMAARLREELRAGRSPRAAVAHAVRHAAPAIGAAGLILAASFGTLAIDPAPATKQMGFAMALGILIAAFVVSTLLVPALTALAGRAAFWPGLRRRAPARDDAKQPAGVA